VKRCGQLQRKRVRRERSRLQQQLQQLCKEYADGARDMQQYSASAMVTPSDSISNNGINVFFFVNCVLVCVILNKHLR